MAEIKFCENNFDHGVEQVIEKLKAENIGVEVEGCLAYCGECAEGPFALVDDELIQADSAEALYEKIKKMIE